MIATVGFALSCIQRTGGGYNAHMKAISASAKTLPEKQLANAPGLGHGIGGKARRRAEKPEVCILPGTITKSSQTGSDTAPECNDVITICCCMSFYCLLPGGAAVIRGILPQGC